MRRATFRSLLAITLPLLSWSCAKADREPFGTSHALMLTLESERVRVSRPDVCPVDTVPTDRRLASSFAH